MTHDVIIAGAGPVGLFLACDLGRAGLSVLVLERIGDPASPLKRAPFGLRGLWTTTAEAFYRRGWLDDLAAPPLDKARGAPHWMQQARRPAGHFAGIQFYDDDVDTARWPWRLPSPADVRVGIEMQRLETVLAARALALGVEIRRGYGVEGFEASGDGVMVRAGADAFHGRWLVGCDGARSVVRKAGGFTFAGTEPEFTGYSIEADLADPDILPLGRHYTPTGLYTYARPGAIAMADFDGGLLHRAEITLEHAQAVLRRISGVPVALTALHLATTWTDRAFQATEYRRGRVLLAGDAAHIHSPLGGQGLNLGLGDAVNLGWKLAAVLRGDAPEDLLDSYEAERRPVGERVLDWSRAQVALMRPSPSTRALAAIVRDLIETRDGATYFAERVWGVSLRYDLGAGHPLVGLSAPDFELSDGRRLGGLFEANKGLLLDFASSEPLRVLAAHWTDRIAYVAADAKDRLGLSALLLRPDGVVAWAAEDEPDVDAAEQAARRWFGAPSQRAL